MALRRRKPVLVCLALLGILVFLVFYRMAFWETEIDDDIRAELEPPASTVSASKAASSASQPSSSPPDSSPAPEPAPSTDPSTDPATENEETYCILEAGGTCIRYREHDESTVCARFVQDTTARTRTGIWTPGRGRCELGQTSAQAIEDAVARTNMYRWMVGLAPVVDDPTRADAMESCALILSVAKQLDHHPPEEWECWEASGDDEAGKSNLSLGRGTPSLAVDGLIVDSGANNELTLGHRRWILLPSLESVAFGYSAVGSPVTCMHVAPDGAMMHVPAATLEDVLTWPAMGSVPLELVHKSNLGGDVLRWTVSAHNANFEGATARLYQETTPGQRSPDDVLLASKSARLLQAIGDDGLWIEPSLPMGAGLSYRVDIQGGSLGDFSWRTTFADCGMVVPETCDPVQQDCPIPGTGCYGRETTECMETRTVLPGAECHFMNECEPGSMCLLSSDGRGQCESYCALDPSSDRACTTVCPRGSRTINAEAGWGMCF